MVSLVFFLRKSFCTVLRHIILDFDSPPKNWIDQLLTFWCKLSRHVLFLILLHYQIRNRIHIKFPTRFGSESPKSPSTQLMLVVVLSVPKVTANLCCICLSLPQIYTDMQYRYVVNFGTLSKFTKKCLKGECTNYASHN